MLVAVLPLKAFSQDPISVAGALYTLEEIDKKISEQINSIDNLATNTIGNSGNMLLSIISRLRKELKESVGDVDKTLRGNQLTAFNQIRNLFEDFNSSIEGNIENINEISVRISQTADDLLVKNKEPNIYSYNIPPFIKKYSDNFKISMKGKNFDRLDDIKLEIGESEIEPVQKNYQELIFIIDSAIINNFEKFANAEINFKWRSGLFNRKNERSSPILLPITPKVIGSVTVVYEQDLPEKIYSDPISYSCDCKTGSPGLDGSRERSSTAFNINPTNGKLIDPSSIDVKNWSQRYGGERSFDHVTTQQIRGEITCTSQAKPYGGGGFSTLTFTYKEYETKYFSKENSIEKDNLTSFNPSVINLPAPVDNNRPNLKYVLINTFDDKEFVLTPTNTNNMFRLDINPTTDDVIVEFIN